MGNLDPTSRDSDLIGLKRGHGSRILKSYPGDSNVQPGLRTTVRFCPDVAALVVLLLDSNNNANIKLLLIEDLLSAS